MWSTHNWALLLYWKRFFLNIMFNIEYSHFCFSEVFWNYGQQTERSICFSWIWLWNYGQHMEWAFCFSGKKEFWKYGTVQFWWTLYPHWKQWKQQGRSPNWCFIIPHDGETFFVAMFIARCLYVYSLMMLVVKFLTYSRMSFIHFYIPFAIFVFVSFWKILAYSSKGNFGNPWKLLATDGKVWQDLGNFWMVPFGTFP